jgi:SAM-dependent methyltransferase
MTLMREQAMIDASAVHATRCAICHIEGNATELYPANFDQTAFTEAMFSARRLPDTVHYRIVKCNKCGLVRSDPIVDATTLARLYRHSTFTYEGEVPDLKYTYGRYLARLEMFGVNKGALLEIGGGNGFFLEVALQQGYAKVSGVEPSSQAIAQADPTIRPFMLCDRMRPGLFESESFDVICLFQVFDHVPDPGAMLDECYRILKPGGMLLAYNHNVEAVSARLLGEKSPIIDIEHTYLYSFKTMAQIAQQSLFTVREVGTAYNRYKLLYLVHLLPLPKGMKERLLVFLKHNTLGRLSFLLPLGNLYLVAQKMS